MESLTDTIAATRRLLNLGEEATLEAEKLVAHYRAHHVAAAVFDSVSLLTSAALRASREADLVLAYGDDNDLRRAEIVADEIAKLVAHEADYRRFIDRRAGTT